MMSSRERDTAGGGMHGRISSMICHSGGNQNPEGWRAEWIADQVRNDTIELYSVNTGIEEHSGKFPSFACSDMAQSIGITDCDTVCKHGMTVL